jgi:hypothetical protein
MSEEQLREIELLEAKLAAAHGKHTSSLKTIGLLTFEVQRKKVEAGLATLPAPRTRKPKDPKQDAVPPVAAAASASISASARGKGTKRPVEEIEQDDGEQEEEQEAFECVGNLFTGAKCPGNTPKHQEKAGATTKHNKALYQQCKACKSEHTKERNRIKKAAAAEDEEMAP